MFKTKVFLGDLVHDWEKVSVWTLPLNIGYIASYAQKIIGPEVEFTLFKRPGAMLEAIRKEKPDVVGLSYYVWNENLNDRVMEFVKETSSKTLTVGGGPHFTNLNVNEDGAREFFSEQSHCDAFVFNQGERGFAETLKRFRGAPDLKAFKSEAIPGVITNLDGAGYRIGDALDALEDLDEIPSPYLSGMLDQFFHEPMVPLVETNRSCPYRCTFCAWGIGTTKLSRFSDQRILDEIDYISERCKKSVSLFFCDANYGILDRDEFFAKRIHENKLKHGFPGNVSCQWNKSQPGRVMKVVKAFNGLAPLGASCQTLHKPTLDAIKRVNLPLEKITEMAAELKRIDPSYTMFSELNPGSAARDPAVPHRFQHEARRRGRRRHPQLQPAPAARHRDVRQGQPREVLQEDRVPAPRQLLGPLRGQEGVRGAGGGHRDLDDVDGRPARLPLHPLPDAVHVEQEVLP
jgi:hypothetical protein